MTHWLLYIERLSRYSVFLVKCSLRLIYAVHGYHEILLFAAPRILVSRSSARHSQPWLKSLRASALYESLIGPGFESNSSEDKGAFEGPASLGASSILGTATRKVYPKPDGRTEDEESSCVMYNGGERSRKYAERGRKPRPCRSKG